MENQFARIGQRMLQRRHPFRLSVTVGGEAVKVKVPPPLALALRPGSAVELSWERDAARLLSLNDRETA